ncbi:MAG: hypothetical protein K2Q14_05985 [Gammaproteobacteria bacterium]|nr:hypothetical protein [Gammaproteobacteria bacterium]
MDKQDKEVLKKIGNIGSGEVPPSEPDILTLAARQALGEEKEKVEIDNIKAAFKLSNELATRIFWLVVVWVIAIFVFLFYQSLLSPDWRLNDSVLIALLSTTTVNILALLLLVIKYVFNHRLKL